MAFRVYVAEGIKVLTSNTANAWGGSSMSLSYLDMIQPTKVDNRNANDVKNHMKNILRKAGES